MKILLVLTMLMSFLWAAIDINTASKKELISLKGIGPRKAEAIISYRQGKCFKTVESLMLVKGIGVKTFEKNRNNLKVSGCK